MDPTSPLSLGLLNCACLQFWTGLRVLHTRNIEVDHNLIANVVRDTSDAGALEYWGIGAFNTAHHNCLSDMDPGLLTGDWMNFFFQDVRLLNCACLQFWAVCA